MSLRPPFPRQRETGRQMAGNRSATMTRLPKLGPHTHPDLLLSNRFRSRPDIAAPLRRLI